MQHDRSALLFCRLNLGSDVEELIVLGLQAAGIFTGKDADGRPLAGVGVPDDVSRGKPDRGDGRG